MSNYHVLQTVRKDRAQIVFHIAVPDEVNVSGVNLQLSVSQYVSEGIVSQVPWLQADFASEYTQIQNGEIYEHVEMVEYDANLNNVAKQVKMDTKYSALVTTIQNKIRDQFKFWGLNRDVT